MYSAHTLFYESCACLQAQTNYSKGEREALVAQLMEWHFGLKRIDVVAQKTFEALPAHIEAWQGYIARLARYEPLQHLTQKVEFCGIELIVSPDVLIPRPETEEWVQRLIAYNKIIGFQPTQIIDICTGSGCIAIALALAYPQASTQAWDISRPALAVAQKNALQANAKIDFHEIDILADNLPTQAREGLLLVSNPPYIPQKEATEMQRNVLDYEPSMALFVPDDEPLLFYKRLAYIAQKMQPHVLAGEIHEHFGEAVAKLWTAVGTEDTQIWQDFHGKARCVVGKYTWS